MKNMECTDEEWNKIIKDIVKSEGIAVITTSSTNPNVEDSYEVYAPKHLLN